MEEPCKGCELAKITTKEALLSQSHVPCYRSYQQGSSEFETTSGSNHSRVGTVMDVKRRSISTIVFYFLLAVRHRAHSIDHEDAVVLVGSRSTCLAVCLKEGSRVCELD
jgi:hypothetical protein